MENEFESILLVTDFYYPHPTSIGICIDKLVEELCTDSLEPSINADTDIFYTNKITVSKIMKLIKEILL